MEPEQPEQPEQRTHLLADASEHEQYDGDFKHVIAERLPARGPYLPVQPSTSHLGSRLLMRVAMTSVSP